MKNSVKVFAVLATVFAIPAFSQTTTAANKRYNPPLDDVRITSPFGPRDPSSVTSGASNFANSRFHQGIDFAAPLDTNVFARYSGAIESINPNDSNGGGKVVKIRPKGEKYSFQYLHLFRKDQNNPSKGIVSGPFKLKNIIFTSQSGNQVPCTAILWTSTLPSVASKAYVGTNCAYQPGDVYKLNAVNYVVTKDVVNGNTFAPTGNSPGVQPHLHLGVVNARKRSALAVLQMSAANAPIAGSAQLLTNSGPADKLTFSTNDIKQAALTSIGIRTTAPALNLDKINVKITRIKDAGGNAVSVLINDMNKFAFCGALDCPQREGLSDGSSPPEVVQQTYDPTNCSYARTGTTRIICVDRWPQNQQIKTYDMYLPLLNNLEGGEYRIDVILFSLDGNTLTLQAGNVVINGEICDPPAPSFGGGEYIGFSCWTDASRTSQTRAESWRLADDLYTIHLFSWTGDRNNPKEYRQKIVQFKGNDPTWITKLDMKQPGGSYGGSITISGYYTPKAGPSYSKAGWKIEEYSVDRMLMRLAEWKFVNLSEANMENSYSEYVRGQDSVITRNLDPSGANAVTYERVNGLFPYEPQDSVLYKKNHP